MELADARAPATSRHPRLPQLAAGRPRFLVLARADLADPALTRRWVESLAEAEPTVPVVAADLQDPRQHRGLLARLQGWVAGLPGISARLVVTGLPNVGKSSLINSWCGRGRLATANRPGVTVAPQWIRVNPRLMLMDTPGVFAPSPRTDRERLVLSCLGILSAERYDPEESAEWLIHVLWARPAIRSHLLTTWHLGHVHPATPEAPISADAPTLDQIATARHLWRAGGQPDCERAAEQLLAQFRAGGWGRLTLEEPPG